MAMGAGQQGETQKVAKVSQIKSAHYGKAYLEVLYQLNPPWLTNVLELSYHQKSMNIDQDKIFAIFFQHSIMFFRILHRPVPNFVPYCS